MAADITEDSLTGLPHYEGRVVVSKEQIKRLSNRPLRVGMPAEIAVITGSKTALAYLLQPLRDSLFKAWRES